MGETRRALELRLASLPAAEKTALHRVAARLRDEARRAARVTRGGARTGSGRDAAGLPPWAHRMRDADLEAWVLRLFEDQVAAATAEDDPLIGRPGVVVWAARKVCHVQADGETFAATLSGVLARNQRAALAVGDEVLWAGDPDPRVIRVLPRRSFIARPDPHDAHGEQVIAANVEVAVIVAACKAPPLRARLIDRYLVLIGRGGAQPLLCLNKRDQLETAEDEAEIAATLAPYLAMDLPVLRVSARTGQGLGALQAALLGRTAVFVGHSGVGKSSLLNALFPGIDLPTGDVNAFHGKGRHTTTAASLLDLGGGTRLIDTPGVRSLGMGRLSPEALREAFSDFAAFTAGCLYRDCTHAGEPDCAIDAAVAAGAISPHRLDSYRRLLASLGEEGA